MSHSAGNVGWKFLSTPSARRATNLHFLSPRNIEISIHALREEGDGADVIHILSVGIISIHALREEGDMPFFVADVELGQFLSTPSARRATRNASSNVPVRKISIHALREEGDAQRISASCRE